MDNQNLNVDRNDVPLSDAPASVDGHQVLKVLQVSISDNPGENAYKAVLDDGNTVSIPMNQFTAGAAVVSAGAPVEQPTPTPTPAPVAEIAAGPIDNTQTGGTQ